MSSSPTSSLVVSLKRKTNSDLEKTDSTKKDAKKKSKGEEPIKPIDEHLSECSICITKYDKDFKYMCYNCGNIICLDCKQKVSTGRTIRCPSCKNFNPNELNIANHRKNIEQLLKFSREHKNYKIIYEEIVNIDNLIAYEIKQGSIDCANILLEICELFVIYKYYNFACKWYKYLVGINNIIAHIKLGKMYEHGYYVQKDYTESARLYKEVIKKGDGLGNYFLAHLYENGMGVKQDYKEACELYKKYTRDKVISRMHLI